MVRDLQIAQARRDGGEQARDRRPPAGHQCLWCDAVGHTWKDCRDFAEAMRSNVVYLWNGRAYDCETRRALDLIISRGGMKRLMEEAAARHAKTIHYSTSARIRVGSDKVGNTKSSRFWLLRLEGLVGVRLRKEEATARKNRSGR